MTNNTPLPQGGADLVDQNDGCTHAGCPDAPTGSAAPGPGHGQITVTWTPAATGGAVSSWDLKAKLQGASTDNLKNIGGSSRTYTYSGLDPTKSYGIVVQGRGANAEWGNAALTDGVAPRDANPPMFKSATVNGTTLKITFDETLASGGPTGLHFVIESNSGTEIFGNLQISPTSGSTVTVTLNTPADHGETYTVSYFVAAAAPLRDAAGNNVAEFSGKAVTNTTPPAFDSAAVNGNQLVITFDANLDKSSAPTATHFGVIGPDNDIHGSGIVSTISGATVTATLGGRADHGKTYTLTYTKAATNPLKDAAGNEVASFSGKPVTNNTPDTTPPAFDSAALQGDKLVITFDKDLDGNSAPAGSEFSVTTSSATTTGTAAGVTISGSTVNVTLTAAVSSTETVTVSYTKPTSNPLKDAAGNAVADFSGNPVTNNPTPPGFDSAAVNGDQLVITFDKDLDGNSAPAGDAFGVSGGRTGTGTATLSGPTATVTLDSAVAHGETVTLSYNKPANNPLQDAAGNEVAGFADQPVTNGTPASVTAVAIVSTPLYDTDGDDTPETYGQGDEIRVQVTFNAAVTVGGTPRLAITLFTNKWANYESGGGTTALTFAYTVVATNQSVSTAVVANTLEVNGGTITDAGGLNADLAHPGLAPDAAHAVNGSLLDSTPPAPDSAAVNGDQLVITFDENLDSNSAPAGDAFGVSGGRTGTGTAALSGATVTVTLDSAVAYGETVTVDYTAPGSSPLSDVHGNDVADFSGQAVTNDTPQPGPSQPGPSQPGSSQPGPSQPAPPEPPADAAGRPVADAGADRTVNPASAVTLDGSGSWDPDGGAMRYAWTRGSGAAVTLSGADTDAPSFTAPEMPGVLTFRLTVTDPGGLADSDDVTVTVRDLAPGFGDAAVAALTLERGAAMDPVALPEAAGGNGELSYTLASAPAGLAGLDFDAATRRLSGTPETVGSYVFTWRADDADANRADTDAAILTFRVTVELDARTVLVKRAVERTLTAVARRSLTSALDNVGTRFASAVPASGLTLAGETVPFNVAGAGSGLAGAEQSCTPGAPDLFGFGRAGFGGGDCAPVARGRRVDADALLSASSFSLALDAAEGEQAGTPAALLWSVWGRGEFGTFAGRPEGMRYQGELRTGWLGVDVRSGSWVAGVALSRGTGETDYSFGGAAAGRGRLETELTALYPYGSWTLADGLELRGVLGAGRGEARHRPEDGPSETSDLSMWMASAGLRHALPALAGFRLAVRADTGLARMETGKGQDHVDGLTGDMWRLRAGLEASRRIALAEPVALTPFVEAGARQEGGNGLAGTGLELVGGLRFEAARLHIEARGRWLAIHSEKGAQEQGVSLTARVGPGAQGRGLSLALSPRWGAGTGSADALWGDELPTAAGAEGDAAVDARIGYGVDVAEYGLLTPFTETGLTGEGANWLRLGTRFEAAHADFGVELAGERRDGGAAGPEHLLRLDARLRF